jgi:hypothetical protein
MVKVPKFIITTVKFLKLEIPNGAKFLMVQNS